jgi:hypothetical protein
MCVRVAQEPGEDDEDEVEQEEEAYVYEEVEPKRAKVRVIYEPADRTCANRAVLPIGLLNVIIMLTVMWVAVVTAHEGVEHNYATCQAEEEGGC